MACYSQTKTLADRAIIISQSGGFDVVSSHSCSNYEFTFEGHSVKKKVWTMQNEMLRQRFMEDGGSSSFSEVSVIATEYRPVLKWVGYRKAGDVETHGSEDESLKGMSIDEEESEISDDDDIEDW